MGKVKHAQYECGEALAPGAERRRFSQLHVYIVKNLIDTLVLRVTYVNPVLYYFCISFYSHELPGNKWIPIQADTETIANICPCIYILTVTCRPIIQFVHKSLGDTGIDLLAPRLAGGNLF